MSVNEQLVKEIHEPVLKKFKTRKVYARYKDNAEIYLKWNHCLQRIKILHIYYV